MYNMMKILNSVVAERGGVQYSTSPHDVAGDTLISNRKLSIGSCAPNTIRERSSQISDGVIDMTTRKTHCKKTVNVESQTVTFDFSNDTSIVVNVAELPEIVRQTATVMGINHRVGDSYAGCKTPQEAYEKALEAIETLEGGYWKKPSEGGSTSLPMLVEAVIRVVEATGQEADEDVIRAQLKTAEGRQGVLANAVFKAEYEKVRAERAVAKAEAAAKKAEAENSGEGEGVDLMAQFTVAGS